jgi:two-component system, cell cycle sensor histidine kinase and response regulator CckA
MVTPDTILLVEDEPAIRQLMAGALKSRGYCVLEARHGKEALAIFPEHDAVIDLVVTDVRMPYLRGTDMVAALRARRPDLKVLFISGYTDRTIQQEPHLYKPFLRDDFLAAVDDLLRQRES